MEHADILKLWCRFEGHGPAALVLFVRAVEAAERDKLAWALTVCRCAARVVDSSAYQGVSDEDCDLEVAVRNWRALGPNV